jgi:hypothetical protein
MTEEQWLCCAKPLLMLEFLRESGVAAEDRKLRLFAAACCRRAWHLLDADARAAVETSERFADGLAGAAELMAAIWANRSSRDLKLWAAVDHATVGGWRPAVELLSGLGGHLAGSAAPADTAALARERAAEERAQADLLRCVFGPRPPGCRAAEASWRTTTVLEVARCAYEARDFGGLLVLADALEEAGCDDQEFLGHLRRGGPHSRGCFVLDALLGKG